MSNNAVLSSERDGISAQLQARIRSFTSFYEQHAYLAYNLALRITCEPGAAGHAVERGFLDQLNERPPGLTAGIVKAALQEAPATPDPAAAGGPEAQALMSAISGLAPAERAALALADLAHAGSEEIGAALEVPAPQAAKLLERARDGFARAIETPRPAADEVARDWVWAAPPTEIWEGLYQRFHRTVERQLRRGAVEHTLVLKPDDVVAPAKATRRATRSLQRSGRRLRRPRWSVVLPVAAIAVVLAAAGAARMLDSGGGAPPAASSETATPYSSGAAPSEPASGESDVKPRKPLTAALLDKLRLRELRQLRAYSRRQANSSLPARQRRAAARRIAAIERAARARLRAQRKREAQLRDREAREQARAQAPPPPAPVEPRPKPAPRKEEPKPEDQTPGPPRNREEADKTCLLNEETGQYVCPQ